MRFAYADPPYFGCAVRLYGDHPNAHVYDTVEGHSDLVFRLMQYDGWAYSMSSASIAELAHIFPADARWGAWVKPFASFKPNVNPAYAWEPVVFWGGRKRDRTEQTIRDWCSVPITLQRGVPGAKPDGFVRWVLDVLNVHPDDEFDDLFPGSGAVTRAVEAWRAQGVLAL